jgi:hypothetical protein
MAAIIFPTPAQALLQTPLNTFSTTSTPLVNTSNSFTYVYNTTLGVWEGSAGGGGTTVTGVTASLPLVSSGGTTPNLTINAATTALPGSVQLADAAASQAGTSATLVNTPAFSVPKDAANMTGAALIPGGNDAARPSPVTGMFRYNSQGGTPVKMEHSEIPGPHQ